MNSTSAWLDPAIAQHFRETMRGCIPFAEEHLRIMVELLDHGRQVNRLLDLGCGDGVLAEAVRHRFPGVQISLIDFNRDMLDAATVRLGDSVTCRLADLGDVDWHGNLDRFDAIVSGFAIHHLPDDGKHAVYSRIFELLQPNGWFVHIEHVDSRGSVGHQLWHDRMIDALWEYEQTIDANATREAVAAKFIARADADDNRLTPVESQCDWLREIGFEQVDLYFKHFELAVFAGHRPPAGKKP